MLDNNKKLKTIENNIETSIEKGSLILNVLNNQKEVLENTNNKLDDINDDLNISNKIINSMNSLHRIIKNILIKKRRPELVTEEIDTEIKIQESEQSIENGSQAPRGEAEPRPCLRLGVANCSTTRDLDRILNLAKKMNKMAKVIDTELENQNKILDSMDNKTESSIEQMIDINEKINKLL